MIRGPVLPHSRDGLWAIVSARLDSIEQGLTLVAPAFDASNGRFGAVDALARDASGAPVLLVLAVDDDPLLGPRVFDAVEFLQRVGGALASAVPEAEFVPGAVGRVVVVAANGSAGALQVLGRRVPAGVEVCRLEAFRLAGSERFAVIWQGTGANGLVPGASPVAISSGATPSAAPEFACPTAHAGVWQALRDFCARIDSGVTVEGDRHRRRIHWQGHLLGEVAVRDGALQGTHADGSVCALAAPADVRAFSDRLLRRYAHVAGLLLPRSDAAGATSPGRDAVARHAADRGGAGKSGVDSLRSVVAAARLSPEEYSALGGPTSEVGGETEDAATADSMVARIVAAQEGPWPKASTD
jgi:hypothetical protein